MASASPAIAQDNEGAEGDVINLEPLPPGELVGPFKIDDGRYQGVVASSHSMFKGENSFTLWLHRDGSGTASFEVLDEEMVGEWEIADSGGLSVVEHPGLAEADTIGSAVGTLTGSFPYVLAGDFSSDVTATASAAAVGGPNISATESSSGSIYLSFELGQSVQVCGQVQANWDDSFRAQLGDAGWMISVKTQLVALPENSDDELQTRLAGLVESATFAANQIRGAEPAIEFMIGLVFEAEELMSDIENYPQGCSPDQAFMRVINQIIRDMMNTLLNEWDSQDQGGEMFVMRRLIGLGLRSGVLGSGSTDPQAAAFLEEKVITIVQGRFDELIESGSDIDELRQTILAAEMLGHQLAEASNADICVVIEGC